MDLSSIRIHLDLIKYLTRSKINLDTIWLTVVGRISQSISFNKSFIIWLRYDESKAKNVQFGETVASTGKVS